MSSWYLTIRKVGRSLTTELTRALNGPVDGLAGKNAHLVGARLVIRAGRAAIVRRGICLHAGRLAEWVELIGAIEDSQRPTPYR